jgi:hypothetical protein
MRFPIAMVAVLGTVGSLFLDAGFAWGKNFLAHASDNAVFIRWQRSDKDQLFHVYRKTGEGEYVRMNETPIRPMRHRSDVVRMLGTDTPQYLENFKVTYPEQIHDVLDRKPAADVLSGVIDPRVAILRGDGFVDSTVVKGSKYTYKITEVLLPAGIENRYGEVTDVEARTIPPLPPKNLSAKDANAAIVFFMEPAEGHHAGYDILRSDSKEGEYRKVNRKRILLTRSNWPEQKGLPCYTDREVEIGKTYWYKAMTVDILGIQSIPSGPVSAAAFDRVPPSRPTVKKIFEDSKGYLSIEWEQTDLSDVSGFNVYRSASILSPGDKLTRHEMLQPDLRSFQDKSAKSGKAFWYRVSSVDKHGNEAFSAPEMGSKKRVK